MIGLDELQRAVDARYRDTGPPSWPNPHEGSAPRAEEYEQTTDTRRFQAPPLRVSAWIDTLADLGLAIVEDAVEIPHPRRADDTLTRTRVRSTRPDTLPLWVTTGTQDATTLAVVDPQLAIESEPRCGCDACDNGSEQLLSLFDVALEAVFTGTLTVRQDARERTVYLRPYSNQRGVHGLDDPLIGEWHGAAWIG